MVTTLGIVTVNPPSGPADDHSVMTTTTSVPSIARQGGSDHLRGVIRLAALGFGIFIAGAAATMTMAGLFSPLLLVLAAAINLVLMLAICVATAAMLDIGGRHDPEGPTRRDRIARRTLQLAALYWTAAGLAFLFSPLLARI